MCSNPNSSNIHPKNKSNEPQIDKRHLTKIQRRNLFQCFESRQPVFEMTQNQKTIQNE